MQRRTLLTVVGSGLLSLAGCTARTDLPATDGGTDTGTDGGPNTGTETATPGDGTDESTDLPQVCPTSQDLGVEWPTDLDGAAVESFVEEYEHVYYRDVVVDYRPRSRLDDYELSGGVSGPPRRVGDGWKVEYSGSGGIYRPTLLAGATTADPPEGADVVPIEAVEKEPLAATLMEAAETGDAEHHVDPPGEKVDRYVDHLASLSEDFERLSERGHSDTLYVDVDGTTVELTVTATNFHGDYWWNATYYVDEQVVRRTTEDNTDPRNGTVLECRPLD